MRFGRQRLDLVTMSVRELQRIEVLSEVLARRRSEISAAAILGLSTRQTRRLLAAYRNGGGGALIHKARGRTSNNRLIPGIREYVIELVRCLPAAPSFHISLVQPVLRLPRNLFHLFGESSPVVCAIRTRYRVTTIAPCVLNQL